MCRFGSRIGEKSGGGIIKNVTQLRLLFLCSQETGPVENWYPGNPLLIRSVAEILESHKLFSHCLLDLSFKYSDPVTTTLFNKSTPPPSLPSGLKIMKVNVLHTGPTLPYPLFPRALKYLSPSWVTDRWSTRVLQCHVHNQWWSSSAIPWGVVHLAQTPPSVLTPLRCWKTLHPRKQTPCHEILLQDAELKLWTMQLLDHDFIVDNGVLTKKCQNHTGVLPVATIQTAWAWESCGQASSPTTWSTFLSSTTPVSSPCLAVSIWSIYV